MKNIKKSNFNINKVEKNLKSKVFGQDEAVNTMVNYITISEAGLMIKKSL